MSGYCDDHVHDILPRSVGMSLSLVHGWKVKLSKTENLKIKGLLVNYCPQQNLKGTLREDDAFFELERWTCLWSLPSTKGDFFTGVSGILNFAGYNEVSIDILDTRPEDVKADWLGLATLYEEDEDVFSVRASFFGNHRWFHCLREIGLFVFSADLFVIGVVTLSFSW